MDKPEYPKSSQYVMPVDVVFELETTPTGPAADGSEFNMTGNEALDFVALPRNYK